MDTANHQAMTSHSGSHSGHSMDGHSESPHADDPAKQREHMGLVDLLPHSEATHVAVKSGSWFDSSTWGSQGIPPKGAKVLIPQGKTVLYDGESNASLKIVRVDGKLEFAHNKNTKIVVDTLITDFGSTLQIGSEDNPIQSDKTAQIIIDGSTPIDKSWDPLQLSRGVVTHGTVRIFGQDKTDFATIAKDMKAGDSQIILDAPPENWRKGDQIVVGGTSYDKKGSNDDNSKFQDEVLTIESINGRVVTFTNNDIESEPKNVLRFDHARPEGFEDKLNLYVANTTRNVVFKTENADQIPIQQRGHTMFMHNPDVIVENAGFYGLGRTDKNKLVDDIGTNRDGRNGNGTNIRGRYPLHFHKNGADDITSTPAKASGNAIVDSPGWGITHHDSHVVLNSNVVFDVVGSGIASESGNELGAWKNNITIKTTGADAKDSLKRYGPNKPRLDNFDMGVLGEGYWVQGAGQVEMENNVAISAAGGGVNFFGSGDGGVKVRDIDTISVDNLPDSIKPVALGKSEVDVNQVPLRKVSGFESYNSDHGIFVWGRVRDDFGENPHDVFSTIEDFKIWGVRDDAIRITYSSNLEFENGIILGDTNNPTGRAFAQNELANEIYYTDLQIEGFEKGIKIAPEGLDRAKKGEPDTDNKDKHSKIEGVSFANNVENIYREKNDVARLYTDNLEIIDTTFAPVPSNTAPTARFDYTSGSGFEIRFDASDSFDADSAKSSKLSNHEIIAYGWDFDGDGQIDEFGRTAEYIYSKEGTRQVSLTVWDSDGATDVETRAIAVGNSSTPIPPNPPVSPPETPEVPETPETPEPPEVPEPPEPPETPPTNSDMTLTASAKYLDGSKNAQSWGSDILLSAQSSKGTTAKVAFGKGGFAIQGGRHKEQIDFNPSKKSSERLFLDFKNDISQATIELGMMKKNGWKGLAETGRWTAYDANDKIVASGILDPTKGTKVGQDAFSFEINSTKSFARLSIEATGLDNGAGANVTADNSGFNLRGISYQQTASGTPVSSQAPENNQNESIAPPVVPNVPTQSEPSVISEPTPDIVVETPTSNQPNAQSVTLLASDISGQTSTSRSWGDSVTVAGYSADGSVAAVKSGWGGLAVDGGRFNLQVDFDIKTQRSEKLVIDFNGSVTQASVELGRMSISEWQTLPETGVWTAYSEAGDQVGSGQFDPRSATKTGNDSYRFSIDTNVDFDRLEIEASGYGNGAGASQSGNNSDFNLRGVTYTRAGDITVPTAEPPTASTPTTSTPTTTNPPSSNSSTLGKLVSLTASPDLIKEGSKLPQQWGDSGVKISGLDFDGSSIGVVYDKQFQDKGFGVAGSGDRWDQLDFYQDKGNKSEALKLDFNSLVDNVTIIVGQLDEGEGSQKVNGKTQSFDETGKWTAFDDSGKKIGDGLIGPEESALGKNKKYSNSYGKYPIEIDTATPFSSLLIEATGFGYGQADAKQRKYGENNSDFNLVGVSYNPVIDAVSSDL